MLVNKLLEREEIEEKNGVEQISLFNANVVLRTCTDEDPEALHGVLQQGNGACSSQSMCASHSPIALPGSKGGDLPRSALGAALQRSQDCSGARWNL